MFAVAALAYSCFVAFIYIRDPYGRSGLRSRAEMANLPERLIAVSRAMDSQFDAAIIGNSTSIMLQPESLDQLSGRRFVSLSNSGGGPVLALATARLFFRYHPNARALIVAMDYGWCTKGKDVGEQHPYPAWLYGSTFDYLLGLFRHASIDMLNTSYQEQGHLRIDGFHPYNDAFRDIDDMATTMERLSRTTRPTASRYPAPYTFDPPAMLRDLISTAPSGMTFVLFWTPRYLTMQPVEGTSADMEDAACKRQFAEIASPRVRIVDWSGPRPENRDPTNFFDTNHYRDNLARLVERDIADALR
ncbi:hypothetical protein [Bradyrhizobium canariense]|uniref:hypothetical protein n=1 Tax=Bradyrhizobium canariense TaxID=255045 RepID=UPI001B8A57F1|nr:hypothetical protein [Bradyrhizobium canariense]MBR0952898.1 hypothetical protein [Bradyrhizobium canariense]